MLAILVAPALAGAQSEPRTVTLEEAVALTLEANPQVAQAAGSVRTSAAAERSAFGAWLPSLSVGAGGSVSPTGRGALGASDLLSPVEAPRGALNAGVSASWDVYTGGRRSANQARAKADANAAGAGLVASKAQVILLAEAAFFADLRAAELVEVAKARVSRAEEALAAAQKRFGVGSATRSDVLRAELELNTAKQGVLEEETHRNTAAFELGRLIGADTAVHARADSPLEPKPLGIAEDALVAEMISESPAVIAAEATARAADAGVGAARSTWLPTARLSAGYDWFNQGLASPQGNTNWSVGLSLNYPIFDGFVRDEALERARVQDTIAASQLADTRRQVRSGAQRALGQVNLARQRIVLAEQAVEVGTEDLRVQQERYGLGVSTILDLLQSQTNLVEAETNLVTARFDYQLARAELEALVGRKL